MAKVTKKATAKRRVKKNVEHGQAHIQSSFNNTIVINVIKYRFIKVSLYF